MPLVNIPVESAFGSVFGCLHQLWKFQIPYESLSLILWMIILFLEQRLEIVVLKNQSIYGVLVRSPMLLAIDYRQKPARLYPHSSHP